MKMLDEMKSLSIDDRCRLMMRWNVMATWRSGPEQDKPVSSLILKTVPERTRPDDVKPETVAPR
jgi:hypothetical protein